MNKYEVTKQTYITNFEIYKEKTPNEVSGEHKIYIDKFIKLIPVNAKILEFGSAHGRDARYLRSAGMNVLCTDIIPKALKSLQDEGFQVAEYDFRDKINPEWENSFYGIIAKAVFLHASEEDFKNSILRQIKMLKIGGIIFITFKSGEGEEIESDKLGADRYFKYYSENELKNIFNNFSELEILDSSVFDENKWIQFILKKKNAK